MDLFKTDFVSRPDSEGNKKVGNSKLVSNRNVGETNKRYLLWVNNVAQTKCWLLVFMLTGDCADEKKVSIGVGMWQVMVKVGKGAQR